MLGHKGVKVAHKITWSRPVESGETTLDVFIATTKHVYIHCAEFDPLIFKSAKLGGFYIRRPASGCLTRQMGSHGYMLSLNAATREPT